MTQQKHIDVFELFEELYPRRKLMKDFIYFFQKDIVNFIQLDQEFLSFKVNESWYYEYRVNKFLETYCK